MNELWRQLDKQQQGWVLASQVPQKAAQKISRRTSVLTRRELESHGKETECKLALTFDPDRGVPFEGYTYTPVHQDMWQAVRGERKRRDREQTGMFDAAYEHFMHRRDRGDLFNDTEDDKRRQMGDFFAGGLGAMLEKILGSASRAPSEDELHDHAVREGRRKKLRDAVGALGEGGQLILMRSVEGMTWDAIAERTGETVMAVRCRHEKALEQLVRRLRKSRP